MLSLRYALSRHHSLLQPDLEALDITAIPATGSPCKTVLIIFIRPLPRGYLITSRYAKGIKARQAERVRDKGQKRHLHMWTCRDAILCVSASGLCRYSGCPDPPVFGIGMAPKTKLTFHIIHIHHAIITTYWVLDLRFT